MIYVESANILYANIMCDFIIWRKKMMKIFFQDNDLRSWVSEVNSASLLEWKFKDHYKLQHS